MLRIIRGVMVGIGLATVLVCSFMLLDRFGETRGTTQQEWTCKPDENSSDTMVCAGSGEYSGPLDTDAVILIGWVVIGFALILSAIALGQFGDRRPALAAPGAPAAPPRMPAVQQQPHGGPHPPPPWGGPQQ